MSNSISMKKDDYKINSSTLYTIILIRFAIVLLPLNYDYPDEYWQGP